MLQKPFLVPSRESNGCCGTRSLRDLVTADACPVFSGKSNPVLDDVGQALRTLPIAADFLTYRARIWCADERIYASAIYECTTPAVRRDDVDVCLDASVRKRIALCNIR